ncbi:MAG TPA: hypothetical protein VL979_09720 [Solirubrobacteraceae bacterium]|nr:hypothetical protein [Solirubrobacteraceae bacterium]
MNEAVVLAALVLAAVNLLAGALGAALWQTGSVRGSGASRFWISLRVAQGCALAFAIGIGALAAAGRDCSERLFYLYALLPLAVAFVAEQLRVASAQTILDQRGLESSAAVGELPESEQHELVAAIVRREIGVMALSALVVVFLALRAAGTAHGF